MSAIFVFTYMMGLLSVSLACYAGDITKYDGKIANTKSGILCQRWDTNTPHTKWPKYGPSADNYCRYTDDTVAPWCYTTDPNKRWDYCDIPSCSCEPEWTFNYDNSMCYKLQRAFVSFDDAITGCEALGAELAMARNKGENDLLQMMSEPFKIWLGATDREEEGKWVWNDENDVTWSNWEKDEPNNEYNREDCLTLRHYWNGQWNDVPCGHKIHHFIAMKPSVSAAQQHQTYVNGFVNGIVDVGQFLVQQQAQQPAAVQVQQQGVMQGNLIAMSCDAGLKKKADIHFLLDESTSVRRHNFKKQLAFVEKFVDHFTIGRNDIQIGVTTFNTHVRKQFWLNTYLNKARLETAITHIRYTQGTTHTGEALRFVRENAFTTEHGDRPNVPNVLIVITDGKSTNPITTKVEAEKMKELTETNVFAIGVGKAKKTELNIIASSPSNVYTVRSFSALKTILSKLAQAASCT